MCPKRAADDAPRCLDIDDFQLIQANRVATRRAAQQPRTSGEPQYHKRKREPCYLPRNVEPRQEQKISRSHEQQEGGGEHRYRREADQGDARKLIERGAQLANQIVIAQVGNAAAFFRGLFVVAARRTSQGAGEQLGPAGPLRKTGMRQVQADEHHFAQAMRRPHNEWPLALAADFVGQHDTIDLVQSRDEWTRALKLVVLPGQFDAGENLQARSIAQRRHFEQLSWQQLIPWVIDSGQLLAAAAHGHDQSPTQPQPQEQGLALCWAERFEELAITCDEHKLIDPFVAEPLIGQVRGRSRLGDSLRQLRRATTAGDGLLEIHIVANSDDQLLSSGQPRGKTRQLLRPDDASAASQANMDGRAFAAHLGIAQDARTLVRAQSDRALRIVAINDGHVVAVGNDDLERPRCAATRRLSGRARSASKSPLCKRPPRPRETIQSSASGFAPRPMPALCSR